MSQAEGVAKFIRGAAVACDAAPDSELLRRFATGDQQAFCAIVARYGPVIWSVCRRLSRSHHDAEDAFQAVLLVFVRRAFDIRSGTALGSWLYGVAYRVAARVRSSRRAELTDTEPPATARGALDELTVREAEVALHDELARLPEKYRAPLLLCCLDGLSRDEAAERLGWPENRVKYGIERGRELLRARLARRGVALGVPLLTGALAGPARAVPPPLLDAGVSHATGVHPPAALSSLADGVIRTMWLSKWKWAVAACAAVLLAATGGALAALRDTPEAPANPAGGFARLAPLPPPALPAKEQKPAWDVAAEFLQLTLDGKTDDALKRCVPGTVSEKRLQEVRNIGYKEPRITAVLVNDNRAEVVLQRHLIALGEVQVPGHLILMLVRKGDGPWQVKDIDFRGADRVRELLDDYLKGKHDTPAKK